MEDQLTNVETAPEAVEAIEPQVEETAQQQPLTPEETLNSLLASRTGVFDLKITHDDLKYLKNTMQSKIEWKGPNEAYLVIMTLLTLSNALSSMNPKVKEPVLVKLPSSTFETLNYFLSKVSGTGLDSAQRLFSATMILRPTIEALKKLDAEIEAVKAEIEATSEKKA